MGKVKYVRFSYSNGYHGCDVHANLEVPVDMTENEIDEMLNEWGHEQSRDEWWWQEATPDDIDSDGIENEGEYSDEGEA